MQEIQSLVLGRERTLARSFVIPIQRHRRVDTDYAAAAHQNTKEQIDVLIDPQRRGLPTDPSQCGRAPKQRVWRDVPASQQPEQMGPCLLFTLYRVGREARSDGSGIEIPYTLEMLPWTVCSVGVGIFVQRVYALPKKVRLNDVIGVHEQDELSRRPAQAGVPRSCGTSVRHAENNRPWGRPPNDIDTVIRRSVVDDNDLELYSVVQLGREGAQRLIN